MERCRNRHVASIVFHITFDQVQLRFVPYHHCPPKVLRLCWTMNMILKCVVLLFVVGFVPVSTKSFHNCCQSFWKDLEKKSKASTLLCTANNKTFVPFPRYCKSLNVELLGRWDAYHKLCPAIRNKECPNAKSMIFEDYNVDDYAMSVGAPEMDAVTACFWVNTKQEKGYAFYISYAVSSATNQLIVHGHADLRLTIDHGTGGKKVSSRSHNNKINDGRWHHICITWQAKDGQYSFYKDGRNAGSGLIPDSAGKPLEGNGTWVLGQEQDAVGGSFEHHQTADGEFTGFNIWDKVLSPFEIIKMSRKCESGGVTGNVKSWADFVSGIQGNVKMIKSTCC